MTIWTHNTLAFHGCEQSIDAVLKAFASDSPFQKFMPEPVWCTVPNAQGELPIEKFSVSGSALQWSNGEIDNRWLAWRSENWGAKWEPSQIVIEANQVTFLTALQPPRAALTRISRLFPRLRLTLKYETLGHFGYGVIVASNGDIKTTMYDPDNDPLYLELEQRYDQLIDKLAIQGIDFRIDSLPEPTRSRLDSISKQQHDQIKNSLNSLFRSLCFNS